MTKKDYVKIAAVLAGHKPPITDERMLSWWAMTNREMADMLAADNPRFDRARFLKACGMED